MASMTPSPSPLELNTEEDEEDERRGFVEQDLRARAEGARDAEKRRGVPRGRGNNQNLQFRRLFGN